MALWTKKEEYSNVIGPKALEKEIVKALRFESKVFSRTLGPYGANTILEDQMLHHVTTKDGYTVYRSLVLYPRIARTAAKLFQKISGSLNDVVGDGTTSSIVVANELYRIRKLAKKWKVTPRFLAETLKLVAKELTIFVQQTALQLYDTEATSFVKIPEFEDYIKATAAISLNNDWNAGALVAKMFTELKDPRHGFINVEISRTTETHYDLDRGFELTRGMLIPEMVTEPDGKRAIYENPKILLIKGHLVSADIEPIRHIINYVIGTLNAPLVIVAGGFAEAIRETIRQSIIRFAEKNNAIMKILCIETDTESTIGKENLQDLQANIGARIITVDSGKPFPIESEPTKYDAYFGTCKKIIANTTTYTRFIGGDADMDKINFRIADIDKEIDAMKSDATIDNQYNIFLLQRRKASLLGDMVTLCIGGDTMEEKESRSHLYDDAVRGCKSAVRNGIVCGGNTIIPKICHVLMHEVKWFPYYKIINALGNSLPSKEFDLLGFVNDIIKNIEIAYTRAYAIILNNYFNNWHRSMTVAKECVVKKRLFNLVSGVYEETPFITDFAPGMLTENDEKRPKNDSVLNSAEVDTQILTAAVSIIDLVMTSNQFIRVPQIDQMKKNM